MAAFNPASDYEQDQDYCGGRGGCAEESGMTGDLREFASHAANVARERLEPLEDYIRDRPLASVLIGAGVGLFVGLALRRRG